MELKNSDNRVRMANKGILTGTVLPAPALVLIFKSITFPYSEKRSNHQLKISNCDSSRSSLD
jgi:hypothetical protein